MGHQRGREVHAPAHAAAVGAHRAIGGIGEVVNGRNGWLFDVHDRANLTALLAANVCAAAEAPDGLNTRSALSVVSIAKIFLNMLPPQANTVSMTTL